MLKAITRQPAGRGGRKVAQFVIRIPQRCCTDLWFHLYNNLQGRHRSDTFIRSSRISYRRASGTSTDTLVSIGLSTSLIIFPTPHLETKVNISNKWKNWEWQIIKDLKFGIQCIKVRRDFLALTYNQSKCCGRDKTLLIQTAATLLKTIYNDKKRINITNAFSNSRM